MQLLRRPAAPRRRSSVGRVVGHPTTNTADQMWRCRRGYCCDSRRDAAPTALIIHTSRETGHGGSVRRRR